MCIMAFADAQIAQLVEQRTENPRVTGSIPVLGTALRIEALFCCEHTLRVTNKNVF